MYLYKKIINKLILNKLSLSVVESCTGGLLAYNITKYRNASIIFNAGYITYSNESKIKDLKINKDTILKNGSVSAEVAKEMAENLFIKNKSKISISTTGIAGPGGSTKYKPVGLVYVGIHFNSKTRVFKKNFKGTRIQIQKQCVKFIFKHLDNLI